MKSTHAIILAAGRGKRLSSKTAGVAKCLLRFGGHSLLERHLRLLRAAGIEKVTLVTGYAEAQIAAELDALDWAPRPQMLHNSRFTLGSVLSVHVADDVLRSGDDIILMDADVLYHAEILNLLAAGKAIDRIVFDTHFIPGEEPVKLCLEQGRIVEFRKLFDPELTHDTVGETVGFFRLTATTAARFADIVAEYIDHDRADQPHEEALRDLFLKCPGDFDVVDIAGRPWLEIDFPEDLDRARDEILPKLPELP